VEEELHPSAHLQATGVLVYSEEEAWEALH